MKPLHESLDDLQKGKINRREFLKAMALLGVATPAVTGFLQGCAPSPAGTAAPSTGGTADYKALLADATKEYTAAHPLTFDIWEFRPDIVQNSVAEFEKQYDEKVTLEIMPGDYTSGMLSKIVSGTPLDMMYAQDNLVKFYKAGWIQPLDELWSIEEIKAATQPAALEAQTYDGKVLALPYFNSIKPVCGINRILADKWGLKKADYPKTWPETYDLCYRAKEEGLVDIPFMPRWMPSYPEISQVFIGESNNWGDPMFDEELNPVFGPDTIAANVLDKWRQLYVDGIVPETSVTMTVIDNIDGFGSGAYLFSAQEAYDFLRHNDPARSNIAGQAVFAPYAGTPWGYFNHGLYAMVARPDRSALDTARAMRLIEFFGWKDKAKDFFVQKQWIQEENLGVGYDAPWEEPEIQEFLASWVPDPDFQDTLNELYAHVKPLGVWKSVWYPEWNTAGQSLLPQAIVGQKPVKDVITELRDLAVALKQRYG